MNNHNGFTITDRDRVLTAWENSTELVRDFQAYAHEMGDENYLAKLFAEYAEDEAIHASKFLEILQKFDM